MNWRTVIILTGFALFLSLLLCIGMASAADDNFTVTAPHALGDNWTTRTVYQGGTVYWNETVDLRQVEGWYAKLYRYGDESRLIDVSGFTSHILIDPVIFPVGEYHQWAEYEEPRGNTLAFFVEAENVTVAVNETYTNFTGINQTAMQQLEVPLPLERRQVADILVARGDSLTYTNTEIDNESTVWVFGRVDYLYNISCENWSVTLTADQILGLEPGTYTFIIDSPGDNTIPEAQYDPDKEQIVSPFRRTPEIDVAGIGPQVSVNLFTQWLAVNSDDVVTVLKMEVQEPYIEIDAIDMQHYNIDSLGISGYTNLANWSEIAVSLDEDNRSSLVYEPVRYRTNALAKSPGELRQWEVNVPFDEANMTAGQHSVWAHGNYSALAIAPYYVYNMPEGQVTPVPTVRYVGGNLFMPTPTPQVIFNETVRTVETIRVEMVEKVVKVPVDYPTLAGTILLIVLGGGAVIAVIGYFGRVALKAYMRGDQSKTEKKE